MATWYRVRYDDQGRDLGSVMRHLSSMAQHSLEVLWIVNRGNPALLVRCDAGREALLTEGLLNLLPGARLATEDVDGFLADFPATQFIVGGTLTAPAVPDMLIDLKADTALDLAWSGGKMRCPALRTRASAAAVKAMMTRRWPGAMLLPFDPPVIRFNVQPEQVFALPSSERFPTLASRNALEIAFDALPEVSNGLLLGADVNERPVMVGRPARVVWVGSPARLDNVAAWISSRWGKQVVVLDGSGQVGKGWQDVEQAKVFVTWSLPGKSTRINPLARLPQESLDEYAQRVMAWFSALNVNQALLGARGAELVRVCVKLAAYASPTGEIDPSLALNLLVATDSYNLLDTHAAVLNETETAVWRSRDARNDVALFSPAITLIRGVFDRSPEMSMWLPPYAPVDVLDSRWVIFRVPVQTSNQRAYWAGLWPLLKQVWARPDTLVLAFGLGALGRAALSLSVRGASVLVWGRTLLDAVGTQNAATLGNVDLVIGAGADPSHFGRALRPLVKDEQIARNLPHILASQSNDQAVARIGDRVGSLRFQMPRLPATQSANGKAGWATASGIQTPPVVSVMGDEPFARSAILSLVARSVTAGHKVMLLGNRDLWGELESLPVAVVTLSMQDMPMLNPLEPRNPKRWAWWGSGLGLPTTLMQNAYRAGVATLQELLDYLQHSDIKPEAIGSAISVVQAALKTDVFGVAESNPVDWMSEVSALAVESYHPALTRTLAAAAVDSGARLVCWNCPGLLAADMALLNKSNGLIWPDTTWVSNVLVTRTSNGAAKVLPEGLRPLVKSLAEGEAYLYRRGSDEYYQVGVGPV